jgi:regulator of sigma E protease
MHTFLVSFISVLVVLGIMVIVHEFGHFIAAKLCGVRVEQFSVGFPPRLFGVKIGETDYCVSAIPLGGYVKMTGESMPGENMSLQGADGETIEAQKSDPGALTSHPRWQRMIIGVSGPAANFVLAIGLMTGVFMLHNEVFLYGDQPITLDWVTPGSPAADAGLLPGDHIIRFDTQDNPTWQQANVRAVLNLNHSVPITVLRNGQQVSVSLPLKDDSKGKDFGLDRVGLLPVTQPDPVTVGVVTGNSPAGKAGIQPGDKFLTIDGHVFHSTLTVVDYLQSRKGAPIVVNLDHAGKTSTVSLQPVQMNDSKAGPAWRIGFSGTPPPTRVEQLSFPQAIAASVKFNRENSLLILEVLNRLVSHRMSVDTLSGPIGIAQQTGQAWASQNWEVMMQLMTVISLNLGILNLLPFPILDGGMILFLIIESTIRRDVNVVFKERVYQVAFVIIILFFAYIMFNDISKLSLFAKP